MLHNSIFGLEQYIVYIVYTEAKEGVCMMYNMSNIKK